VCQAHTNAYVDSEIEREVKREIETETTVPNELLSFVFTLPQSLVFLDSF
jgi:hypothetical protein